MECNEQTYQSLGKQRGKVNFQYTNKLNILKRIERTVSVLPINLITLFVVNNGTLMTKLL